jgi:hypothetical protein
VWRRGQGGRGTTLRKERHRARSATRRGKRRGKRKPKVLRSLPGEESRRFGVVHDAKRHGPLGFPGTFSSSGGRLKFLRAPNPSTHPPTPSRRHCLCLCLCLSDTKHSRTQSNLSSPFCYETFFRETHPRRAVNIHRFPSEMPCPPARKT